MDARPEIDAKDRSARLGDFLQVRHQGASVVYFWIATPVRACAQPGPVETAPRPRASSLDRAVITILCDPRDRLPGIGKTVEREHQGPLFPKLAGGCMPPQGNELIPAFPNAPSLRQKKPQAWGLGICSKPVPPGHHQSSRCLGLFRCVVQAPLCLGRAGLC